VDDIEDGSDLRRGRPCVHKIYGDDIAINAGNSIYFLPIQLISKNPKYSTKMKNDLYKVMS
jgi:geranylgeranyl diphosphate synthase, type I